MSGITIEGLGDLLKRLNGAPAAIVKAVDIELKDGAEIIAGLAKMAAPANNGTLQMGIGSEKDNAVDLSYDVYSNSEISAYMEFGTGTKVDIPAGLEEYAAQFQGGTGTGLLSAKEAIFEWCRQKGIDEKAWFAIYVEIMTNGVTPHPFFFQAKAAHEANILRNVDNALKEAI